MKTVITTAIFGALALGCSALSHAAASSPEPQAAVQYHDLDLSNPQQVRELYSRITAAADEACTSYAVDGRSLIVHMRLRTCVNNAVAAAVTKIGEPELVAIYNSKHREPVANVVAVAETR
jgi:UrcA family protein